MIALAAMLAVAGCTPGGEFEPRSCPARLPAIAAVMIERRGVARWRETVEEPPCAAFRPTTADIRRFLTGAGRVDPHEVHMTLSESACVADGRVRFVGGGSGRWQVDRFANGWLDRPGRARLTLYCRQCQTGPWMQ